MPDLNNIDVARENEEVAEILDLDVGSHRNWFVTIRFYTVLHYVEQVLQDSGYSSAHHDEREENIDRCERLTDEQYNIYRKLRTLSRWSRYDCIRMQQEHVEVSDRALRRTKKITGFDFEGGSSKYNVS